MNDNEKKKDLAYYLNLILQIAFLGTVFCLLSFFLGTMVGIAVWAYNNALYTFMGG